jgi:hypothetical protein
MLLEIVETGRRVDVLREEMLQQCCILTVNEQPEC